MPEVDRLVRLSEWFRKHCDGEWEHANGIKINTLDNPGWIVRITLKETRLQEVEFEPVKVDRGENDWIECDIRESVFTGAGDLSKLPAILDVFLKIADT